MKKIFLVFAFTSLLFSNPYDEIKSLLGGLYKSFTANFTISGSSGNLMSGKIYYQYPGKLHVKTSDGGVIATNGRYLWIYNPASGRCMKQDVGGTGGGILGILKSYDGKRSGDSFIFRNPNKKITEIGIRVSKGMIRSVRFQTEDSSYTVSFSNVQFSGGIRASLFNYKPPASAQVIENPLNK
ncbi:MAG: outer membrane lipoprotein carrier protein LolA [Candidatus Hydrogenedentota bacterium]|nr:MAG: outer membrane lipoprotein carrier protein LolA [Candidatus Hydrogenedentota bacterium]